MACGYVCAQDQPASAMVFETYEWDFGTIDEADGPVSHTFRFVNISNNPIQIDNVATSCGCTTVQYSTEPIHGGEEGEITVVFNPARYDGSVFREVEILTKDRHNYASLTIYADVNPIPMDMEHIYPHLLVGTIQTNSTRYPFGYINQGDSATKVVRIANVGDKTVRLSVQATGNIRNYQLVIGGTLLLILPLSYVGVTYLGLAPASVFIISIIVTVISQFERIWFVRKQIKLNVWYYLRTVILPILLVTGISSALSIGLKTWIQEIQFRAYWIGPILVILASMLFTCITVYTVGISKTERKHAVEMVKKLMKI